MNDYVGHDKAWRQFATACDSDKIHHGWILAGPRGIGKSAFALRAAAMLVDPENAYASMIARGSHPDILSVKRLPKEPLKEDEVIDVFAPSGLAQQHGSLDVWPSGRVATLYCRR